MTEPRTLTELLDLATQIVNGRKLTKNEVTDFMADLLAGTRDAPSLSIDDDDGFHDPAPTCQVKANDVFVPMHACGHYSPRQASALAGSIYRASLEATAMGMKTPAELAATQAKLRALLPYKNP